MMLVLFCNGYIWPEENTIVYVCVCVGQGERGSDWTVWWGGRVRYSKEVLGCLISVMWDLSQGYSSYFLLKLCHPCDPTLVWMSYTSSFFRTHFKRIVWNSLLRHLVTEISWQMWSWIKWWTKQHLFCCFEHLDQLSVTCNFQKTVQSAARLFLCGSVLIGRGRSRPLSVSL